MHNTSLSLVNQSINAFTGIIPSATDEVLKLRKELRTKESEFAKERAILQQKVEILELQLKDANEREESQKRMHEAMMNCLRKEDSQQTQSSSMSPAERVAQQEIQELRDQKRRIVEEIEYKDKEFRDKLNEKESFIKELQMIVEKIGMERKQIQYQYESDKKEFQTKLQLLGNEKDQIAQKVELRNITKMNQLSMEIERLKLEQQREIEKMKADYETSLKEIKYFHDQEKNHLEHRVERSTNELKNLMGLVKSRDDCSQDLKNSSDDKSNQSQVISQIKKEELQKEIEFMQQEIENMRVQWQFKMEQLTQEKNEAESQVKKLQKQLEKIKNAPKPVKIDLVPIEQDVQQQRMIKNLKEEVQQLQQENDKLQEQIKKLRRELHDNHDYVEKVEQNERKLRNMLKERDSDLDNQKGDLKKQLNQEKRKATEASEQSSKLRDSFEKVKNRHLQDMLEKDEKIIKLTRELRECERKLSDSNKSQTRCVSPFSLGGNAEQQYAATHQRNVSSYSPIGVAQTQYLPNSQNFAFPLANGIGNHNSNQSIQMLNNNNNNASILQTSLSPHKSSLFPEGSQAMKQVSQLELTLLKTCQRMADSASRMECAYCFSFYDTSDFYDHLIAEHTQLPQSARSTIQMNTITSSVNHQTQATSMSTNTNNGAGSGYQSNKVAQNSSQGTVMQLNKKNFQEDTLNTNTNISQQSLSPKSTMLMKQQNQNQQQPPQRFHQNSRSFTCLLNEIEEEENKSSDSLHQNNLLDNVYNNGSQTQRVDMITTQKQSKAVHGKKQSQANQNDHNNNDFKRSRNANNNSTVLIGNTTSTMNGGLGYGNTISSLVRTQKEVQKQLKQATQTAVISGISNSQTRTTTTQQPSQNASNKGTGSVQVITACRTQLQSLKRDNKKLSKKLEHQECKIQEISKDCSQLKKNKKKEDTSKQNEQLTNDIKDLLEKLVSLGGSNSSQPKREQSNLGSYTSRQNLNNMGQGMTTDSIVELRSSTSMSSINQQQKHKKQSKNGHKHISSKNNQAQPLFQNLDYNNQAETQNPSKHHSNKENQNFQIVQQVRTFIGDSEQTQIKPSFLQTQISQLSLNNNNLYDENHISSSELHYSNEGEESIANQRLNLVLQDHHHVQSRQQHHQQQLSMQSHCETERQYKGVSQTKCSNSPQRYQNYFEVLQSMPSIKQTENTKCNKPRYSPTKESIAVMPIQKVTAHNKSKTGLLGIGNGTSSRNAKHLHQDSKHTNNSSQHNLVLYDSSNTDMFKSKNMLKFSCHKHNNTQKAQNNNEGIRRLDFEDQCNCGLADGTHDHLIEESPTTNSRQQLPFIQNNVNSNQSNSNGDNNHTTSSCPSLDEFEESQSTPQNLDSDPFVTGRFNQGGIEASKQFVFNNGIGGKNSTMKMLHHI